MKLLLADDEILSLQMMEHIIDWNSLNIEIIGKAQDGLEALNIIEKTLPDLLITDIRMPHIDGLELIRRTIAIKPDIFIIIVSAYAEFELAREAIRFGAKDYLLKPLNEHELLLLIDLIHKEWQLNNEHLLQGLQYPESGTNNAIILRAQQYIREHYSKDITLENICDVVNVSKNYFSALYKRETGMNIWDYVTEVRIEYAKRLLLTTNLKNYEISFEIGYENPSYFSKTFKKLTGLKPNEFRLQQGRGI